MALLQGNPLCMKCDSLNATASYAWSQLGQEERRLMETLEFLEDLARRLEEPVEPVLVIDMPVDPYRVVPWRPRAHELADEVRVYVEHVRRERGPIR